MQDKKDTFWKFFFGCSAGALLAFGVYLALLINYGAESLPTLPHGGGPFAQAHEQPDLATSTLDYFYKDALLPGYANTSWNTAVAWNDTSHHSEGSASVKATFKAPWAGVAIQGLTIPTEAYNGIALSVYAEQGLRDLYLELYDAQGNTVGRQSIGWYFPERTLIPDRWQRVTIPLNNFSSAPPYALSGFAVVAPSAGIAYVDDIVLASNTPPYPVWKELPAASTWVEPPSLSTLLASTTPTSLPYTLSKRLDDSPLWHAINGTVSMTPDALLMSSPPQGGDTFAVFLGGMQWRDYHVDVLVDWGSGSSLSLVARLSDENNYTTCAFSNFGGHAQIYISEQGVSRLAGETPELAIRAEEAWRDVSLGVTVADNRLSCISNGERVLSATLPARLSTGTIGLEVWDLSAYRVPHQVKSITVTPL